MTSFPDLKRTKPFHRNERSFGLCKTYFLVRRFGSIDLKPAALSTFHPSLWEYLGLSYSSLFQSLKHARFDNLDQHRNQSRRLNKIEIEASKTAAVVVDKEFAAALVGQALGRT
jgi:hypothetical protein